eukprot:3821178-Rhodomonas_salina.2
MHEGRRGSFDACTHVPQLMEGVGESRVNKDNEEPRDERAGRDDAEVAGKTEMEVSKRQQKKQRRHNFADLRNQSAPSVEALEPAAWSWDPGSGSSKCWRPTFAANA